MPSIRIQKSKKPLVKMVVPGRRALGEDWREITISHDGDDYVLDNEAADMPVTQRPIVVPMLGQMSVEQADYIIGWVRKENEYRKSRGLGPAKPDAKTINQMWLDYQEAKLKAFKGQSSFGPGGSTQRESFRRR